MSSASTDFRPGLEGVIAFESEIAEPDRDGGTLRYRGVDIEELVGRYPFENVWGLLVDEDINAPLPPSEAIHLQDPSGSVPGSAPPCRTGAAPCPPTCRRRSRHSARNG